MANSTAKLEKALRRDPDSPRFARLADCYLQRGRTKRALELCQKGCEDFPDYATGFIVLSKCYEQQGALEEAREALSQALRLDPENPSGYKRLAHLFEQLGVAPLVLQSLRQAAYLDPFDASLAGRIDRCASQIHQDAPAPEEPVDTEAPKAPDAEAAQPQAPEDEDRDDLYGDSDDSELLRLLQEIEEEKATEPVPAPAEPPTPADSEPSAPKSKRIATMTLAEIYTTQGLTQKAIETYRELLEQEPTNTIIRSKLSSLEKISNAN